MSTSVSYTHLDVYKRQGLTGHHKILPDEDPVMIAVVVKLLLLIDASAPDPEHIAANVRYQSHGVGIPSAV